MLMPQLASSQQLKAIRETSLGAANGFTQLSDRAKAVKSAVEAAQGGFAKASTVQGVFAAKVKNTEAAIKAQIAALRGVQSTVQLGGALYQKAGQQIAQYEKTLKDVNQASKGAAVGAKGLGEALTAALGPIAAIATAVEGFRRATEAAFGRAQAETRLKALSSAYGENAQTAAMAASASEKFGLTQTEATQAIADVYGRLRPLGFGLKEVNGVYEGFNVLSKQAALSSAEAGVVFTQLSQALGSGVLRGDEFNRMAENMPSILGAVAKELGVSQTQLRGMAAEGKITSEVVVKALQGVAESGGDLSKFLDPSTIAMNSLRKNTEQMFVQIGKLFGPVVVAGMNFLSTAIQKVAEGWQYFSGVLLPKLITALNPVIEAVKKVTAGFNFETIIDAFQGGLIIAINGMTFAVKKLAPIVVFIIEQFAALAQNPVFKFIAEQVGRLVNHLTEARGGVDEYKAKQDAATAGAMDLVKQSSQLPPKIEDAKEKTKQLKEAQDAVTKAIDKTVAAQTTAIDQVLSVTNARIEAEKAINNVLLEQAQRQLDGANSQQERVKAAGRILDLTIEQAKLERDAAYASIEAEQKKIEIAIAGAKLKEQEVRLAVELAKIQGTVLQAHYDTLSAATELVNMAVKQRDAASEVAKYQRQTADASFKGAKSAANAAYQSNITVKTSAAVATNTTIAAESAGKFAANLERGAQAAVNASKTVGFMPATGGAFTAYAGAGGIQNEAVRNQMMQTFNEIVGSRLPENVKAKNIERFSQTVQNIIQQENTPSISSIPNPSRERLDAMMAENAERLRMQTAQTATATSSPSNISPQVSIQTGPVTQMNGTNYVTAQDMSRAVQSGVQQTINMMRNDRGTRQAVGLP
jgi:tape measure domain-containing protein